MLGIGQRQKVPSSLSGRHAPFCSRWFDYAAPNARGERDMRFAKRVRVRVRVRVLCATSAV